MDLPQLGPVAILLLKSRKSVAYPEPPPSSGNPLRYLTVLSCMFLSTVTGEWSSPPETGTKPPPLSWFSFTKIDSRRAVVYGGGTNRGRLGHAYLLELDEWVCAI